MEIKLNDFRYADDDGHLFFIDTIIFKSDTGGLEKYNSLSPRASK